MDDDRQEEMLRDRQDGRVYPLGRALRATFDADNHASLGSDVAGLMIDLSRVPYGPGAVELPAPEAMPSASPLRPSIMMRLGELLGRR